MMLNSSVAIFDHPRPESLKIGADFLKSGDSLRDVLASQKSFQTKVIVFPVDLYGKSQMPDILTRMRRDRPNLQAIVIGERPSAGQLRQLSEQVPLFAFVPSFDDPELAQIILAAVEHNTEMEQEVQLSALTALEHEKLKTLSHELEETVLRREKNLQRAQKRVTTMNRQLEALHRALVAVHKANSVGEVETLLLTALQEEMNLAWIRVFFEQHAQVEAQLDRQSEFSMFKVPLLAGTRPMGKIVFARLRAPFLKADEEFLGQVAEGVALAVDRLTKLDQTEHLKQEWESTFDAISEPLCLTDSQFKIIRTNRGFSQVTGLTFTKLIGQNCFQAFMGKDVAPQLLDPKSLKLEREVGPNGETRTFQVSVQRIRTNESSDPILMVFFHDITEQRRIERQIFESAKMAELGTVGSSIAHELNNPLGGMISFLQLVKMDLPSEDPIREDVEQMEAAGLRCKEIIENLLGFSRRQDTAEASQFDLRDVLKQALKLIELKTRSIGIAVHTTFPPQSVMIQGHANLLAQALNHVFQNALEAVQEKLSETMRFKGLIEVEVSVHDAQTRVLIRDNGIGISPELQNKILNPLFTTKGRRNSGLGLTLAYKIIDDHQGRLEISSQPNRGTEVKISLNNV